MTFKVSFANQIHRISKTPSSYKELTQLVVQLFQNQLPERWTLQYVDSDGDSIMLADEHDFQNLLEGEVISSNKAIKVYVVPVDGINQSQLRADDSVSESQVQKEDDFQVIEKQEPVPVEEPKVEEQEVAEEPKVEEPVEEVRQVEEAPAVEQEEPKVEEVEQEVVHDISEPEQKEEVRCPRKRFGHHGLRLKKILKKLSKTDLSAEKREHLEAKLRDYEASLNAEERERFVAKREEFVKRMTEKRAKADSEFKEKVTDIIYQYLPTIASLTKEYVQEDNKDKPQPEPVAQPKPQVQPTTVTHRGVSCDGCGKHPLTGIRYKCYVCQDFDFCENCEATKEHAHTFIKIRDSESFYNHRREREQRPNHPFHGRGFWGRPSCHRGENRPEQPKTEETNKKVEEPKVPVFKTLIEAMLKKPHFQAPTENKEKVEKEAEDFKDFKKDLGSLYTALPQDFKSLIGTFLGNVPEQLFAEKTEKKEEEKPEEKIEVPKVEEPKVEEIKKEEVIIAEEPVVHEVVAEVVENGPVIQVVENVPEINKEDPKPIKKEYSEEVRSKVEVLREIFPDTNEEELLEFVAKTPNLNIQELVENYLA